MKRLLVCIEILAMIALTALNIAYCSGPEPDVIYPMTNQHIEWTYAGK